MNKLIASSALVLGFGLGVWWAHQTGSTETPASVAHAAIPALVKSEPGLSAGRADVDSSMLRALIREEMTAVMAGKAGSRSAGPTPVATAASPEKLAQRREAQEQIDTMVSQGVWGNEQRLSFQQKILMLDPEQREHALQQLITALNSGTLQASTDGPPL